MSKGKDEDNPVLVAIRCERGLATKLSEELGITRQAVSMWERTGRVPSRHVLAVAKFMRMHPRDVCPELYPPSRKPRGNTRLTASNR